MKNVMKRAWELYRDLIGIAEHRRRLSMALRMAWVEVKYLSNVSLPGSSELVMISNDELPALVGSEKQIAWAEKIRKGILKNLVRDIVNTCSFYHHAEKGTESAIRHICMSAAHSTNKADKVIRKVNELNAFAAAVKKYNEVASRADCRFWIDNRDRLYA